MDFEILYQELQNSTEMIRALLLGISQDEAQVNQTLNTGSCLSVIG